MILWFSVVSVTSTLLVEIWKFKVFSRYVNHNSIITVQKTAVTETALCSSTVTFRLWGWGWLGESDQARHWLWMFLSSRPWDELSQLVKSVFWFTVLTLKLASWEQLLQPLLLHCLPFICLTARRYSHQSHFWQEPVSLCILWQAEMFLHVF